MTLLEPVLRQAVMDYIGPVQVFDLPRIEENVVSMGRALGSVERLLFPVKSFPAPEVIGRVARAGAGFEISSAAEYALLPADLVGRTVSLNAPDPTRPDGFLDKGNQLHIHLDSAAQVAALEPSARLQLALRLSHTALGLPNVPTGRTNLSRFGTTPEAWTKSAPLFRSRRLSGVHIHNGSEANTAAFYRAALDLILSLADEHDIPLGFINLGGGFHPVAQADLAQLLTALSGAAGETPVYIEPGRVLARGAGYLIARIVAIRELGDRRYNVTVDASHDCHAQWARLGWAMAADLGAERWESFSVPSLGPDHIAIHFTGSTCAERDVMCVYRLSRQQHLPVAVGDVLTFTDLPGYSYAWNTSFNGIPSAQVRFVEG